MALLGLEIIMMTSLGSCACLTVQGSMTEQHSSAGSAESPINAEEVIAKCSWFQVTPSSISALALSCYYLVDAWHVDAGRAIGNKCLQFNICCLMCTCHVMPYVHAQAGL